MRIQYKSTNIRSIIVYPSACAKDSADWFVAGRLTRGSWLSARRAVVGSLSRTRTAHRLGWCVVLSRESAPPLCACAHTPACHARYTTLHVFEACALYWLTNARYLWKLESETRDETSFRELLWLLHLLLLGYRFLAVLNVLWSLRDRC